MQHLNRIKTLCLILFSTGCLISFSYSQVEAVVKGKVVNENGIPVKSASVKLGNTDARTNSTGFFSAKTTSFPAKLTVNHPLYVEYTYMVTLPERWKDTIRVLVILTGKEKELEEVTVSAEKVFWVYPQKQANVLDFILQPDNGILLCCSDENRYFMRSLNAEGEKINETPIRSHPKKLYRDCTETIHLVYSDSIYETTLVNNCIGFFEPRETPGIFNLLQSCVYKDNRNLIKYTYSQKDQSIEYTSIDIQTRKARTMYIGENHLRNKALEEFGSDNNISDEQLFHTLDPELIRIVRSKWAKRKLYEQVLTRPVYIPLFEVNDSLVIFNHINDSAVVFTKEGVFVRSFPIFYQYFDGWENELITNLEKTKLYARYKENGLTILREINPTNGKTEQLIRLEKHVFPEHLQIQGNSIYYIYKDYLDQSMHYLYKQYLE